MALRILLDNVQSHATRYGRFIEPMMSIYVDFYVRIFVRVHESRGGTKNALNHSGMLYKCTSCESFFTRKFAQFMSGKYKILNSNNPKKCPHCNGSIRMGGPLWLDPIHNQKWLDEALDHLSDENSKKLYGSYKRILGLLSVCKEELPNSPLFHSFPHLCLITQQGLYKFLHHFLHF